MPEPLDFSNFNFSELFGDKGDGKDKITFAPKVNHPSPKILANATNEPRETFTFDLRSWASSTAKETQSTKSGPFKFLPKIHRGDEEEFELMQPAAGTSKLSKKSKTQDSSLKHDYVTAPLMTRDAFIKVGLGGVDSQYGVLGQILSVHNKTNTYTLEDSRLYLNTNAPLSALVCGVQGSGKSHTVAAMLESMFIPDDKRIGKLSKPLSGLVLHMGDGGQHSSPNETAWLAKAIDSSTEVPKIKVYVSPSSLNTMKEVYNSVDPNIKVRALYFTEDELDAQAFLSMMAVNSSESAPLYVQIILSILRELGERYSYRAFKTILEEKRRDFNPQQEAGLKQRMALLESFMSKKRDTHIERFEVGQITIVDLSDPFIDPASACGIFEVVTRLFVRADVGTGKVMVVDEAHKYISNGTSASGLMKTLLTLIREQRHKGMRVVISTQEPTVVPPVLIDLCTVAILHRFSSLSWWEHVMKHVSAELTASDAFDRIVRLKTGEAIVLAPSGIFVHPLPTQDEDGVGQYGRRYLHVRVRRRITEDGGSSIMVV